MRLKRSVHDADVKSVPAPASALNDPFSDLLTFHLRRASLIVAADLGERLVDLSLTVTSLSVLLMVEANAGVTQTELGRALGIKRANLAPLTATLAARDLIQRNPTDGRSHGLRLTETGLGLADLALRRVRETEALLSNRMAAGEPEALAALLVSLRTSMRDEPHAALETSPLR